MKNLSTLFFLLLAVISVSAQTINITKKEVFIKRVNVSQNWLLSEFKIILGEPDRSDCEGGVWCNHYYDKKGIELSEGSNKKEDEKGKVIEVEFHYNTSNPELNTTGVFSGSLTVNNFKVSKTVSAKELSVGLNDMKITLTASANTYKWGNELIHIYFVYNADETELQSVSVGYEK